MEHIVKNDNLYELVGDSCIFITKWHDYLKKAANRSLENSVLSIIQAHFDLVISTETIHNGEHQVFKCGIDHVHVWQRKHLWACFVEVVKVYAAPNLSVLLFSQNYIGKPNGVLDGLLKLTSNNLWISRFVCTLSYGLKFLDAYFIGLALL